MNTSSLIEGQPVEVVVPGNAEPQFVDPGVSQAKFDEEVGILIARKEANQKRGILLLEATFPNVYLAFAAPQLRPAPIVFAVKVNFDNYDVEPLSIQFVDPFSREPILVDQLKTPFLRKQKGVNGQPDSHQTLIVALDDKVPFLCLPGVRQYHKHPFHTGDSWLLHRKVGGEGTFGFLVEKLYQYGIEGLGGYHLQLNFGFNAPQLDLSVNQANIPE